VWDWGLISNELVCETLYDLAGHTRRALRREVTTGGGGQRGYQASGCTRCVLRACLVGDAIFTLGSW